MSREMNKPLGLPSVIELPVVLLELQGVSTSSSSSSSPPSLAVVDTFHAYVRPTYAQELTVFCKTLTGISQAAVNAASPFLGVLEDLFKWLFKHELLDVPTDLDHSASLDPRTSYAHPYNLAKLKKDVIWCSHGPCDLRDFVPKSCFIAEMQFGPPDWFRGPVLDVRKAVFAYTAAKREVKRQLEAQRTPRNGTTTSSYPRLSSERSGTCPIYLAPFFDGGESRRKEKSRIGARSGLPNGNSSRQRSPLRDGTIPALLDIMKIAPFEGRLHCGMDDTKNLARVLVELTKRVLGGEIEALASSALEEGVKPISETPDGSVKEEADEVLTAAVDKLSLENDKDKAINNGTSPSAEPHVNGTSTPLDYTLFNTIITSNVWMQDYPPNPPSLTSTNEADREREIARLSDSERKLMKGGWMYYPKRWDWMGKRVGKIKWDKVASWDDSD